MPHPLLTIIIIIIIQHISNSFHSFAYCYNYNLQSLIEPVSPKAGVWKRIWSYRRVGLALLSPMFMWYLFSGQATGRILPDGYEQTLKRYGYGEDLVYTNYVDNTPLIIPNPFKLFSPPKA